MNREFEVHKLNERGFGRAKRLAEVFDECLDEAITTLSPFSGKSMVTNGPVSPQMRYVALVKTKMEEACFFAKKALAQLPENTEGA